MPPDNAVFANIFIKNRPFFGKMRNLNYRRSQEVFGRVQALGREKPSAAKELIKLLEEYIGQLELTYQYAADAIRGLKRQKLRMYRVDKVFGVLEEEIVL